MSYVGRNTFLKMKAAIDNLMDLKLRYSPTMTEEENEEFNKPIPLGPMENTKASLLIGLKVYNEFAHYDFPKENDGEDCSEEYEDYLSQLDDLLFDHGAPADYLDLALKCESRGFTRVIQDDIKTAQKNVQLQNEKIARGYMQYIDHLDEYSANMLRIHQNYKFRDGISKADQEKMDAALQKAGIDVEALHESFEVSEEEKKPFLSELGFGDLAAACKKELSAVFPDGKKDDKTPQACEQALSVYAKFSILHEARGDKPWYAIGFHIRKWWEGKVLGKMKQTLIDNGITETQIGDALASDPAAENNDKILDTIEQVVESRRRDELVVGANAPQKEQEKEKISVPEANDPVEPKKEKAPVAPEKAPEPNDPSVNPL